MIRKIVISDAAHSAILSVAEHPFRETGKQLPDSMWEVPLEDYFAVRLEQEAFPGESPSDVIIRLTTRGVRQ